MATRTWIGRALDVSHALRANVTAYDAATTYSVTVNTKAISVIAQGNSTATATALVSAWNSSTAAEFQEATATANGTFFELAGVTAGKPLAVTSAASGGTGTFGAFANTTAPTGKSWWNNANNWSEGSVPTGNDTVVIDAGPSILYGVDYGNTTLARLYIGPNFPATSEIGLPENTNPQQPSAGYPEYRTTRLTINASQIEIAAISKRIRLNANTANSTIIVNNSGQPQVAGETAIDIVAGNGTTSAAVFVTKGNLTLNGNVSDLNVSFRTSQDGDVQVKGHRDLILTNLDQSGGTVEVGNGVATVAKTAGALTLTAGTITTLNNNGGTFYHDGNGTLTTVNNYGFFERRSFRSGTITTLNLFAKSRFSDRNGTLTITNPVALSGCRLSSGPEDRGDDVAYADFGRGRTLTVS